MTTVEQKRHPSIGAVLRHFEYDQLPQPLMQLGRHFHDLAHITVALVQTDVPQLTMALNKLLEAKDCAVRAYRIDLETRSDLPATASAADLDMRDKNERSRWRPIDGQGNIGTEPAPEPKDDPDEGETGPEEIRG